MGREHGIATMQYICTSNGHYPCPSCMLMAPRLQGRGSAEDVAGARAYLAIQDDIEEYAKAHPKIRPIIDPMYLVRCDSDPEIRPIIERAYLVGSNSRPEIHPSSNQSINPVTCKSHPEVNPVFKPVRLVKG